MKAVFSVIILIFMAIVIVGCGDQAIIPTAQEENDVLGHYKSRQNEIDLVDLNTMSQITEQILSSNPGLTNHALRAKIFDELVNRKKLSKEHILAGPSVPGYNLALTWSEFWLLIWYPENIQSTQKASNYALAEASRQWRTSGR